MSGPTWLPPRTLESPERPSARMAQSSPGIFRPHMKVPVETRLNYGAGDRSGASSVMAARYLAAAPVVVTSINEDCGTTFNPMSPKLGDHYYPSPHTSKDDGPSWNVHMGSYDTQKRASDIDAEIDSLTCMLADLDKQQQSQQHNSQVQVYDNVPYTSLMSADRCKPPAQGRGFTGYSPHSQSLYSPAPPYPGESLLPAPQQDFGRFSSPLKPYPQPVPASYTTASTPTGPRFSVQVRTAQPVTSAQQAYTPPARRPPQQAPDSPAQQAWYPPLSAVQDQDAAAAYKGSVIRPSQAPLGSKKNPDVGSVHSSTYQAGKASIARPEEELDRLTKKLVYDMNHPHTEEYFGRCARCGDKVLGDGSGCVAMEQVFHVDCFTCITCHTRLRGQPFYAVDKKSYCESCYISTLERCSKCSSPILDRILRAMGKAYHPRCFTCVVCGSCLDGVPFTVDATSQIHCIEDFHRKFAPRCSVCGQAIMPEPGQEETVRIVALDRSFHVNCYKCEECDLLLSSEGEGRGCYPLDGHILCKSCSARRIQDLSAKISTDC